MIYLQRLKLSDFKNYETADMVFSEKINCFVGDNGAGKTNILDAIYYLSFCKSYFTSSDRQNIRHGAPFFAIHGFYQHIEDQKTEEKVSIIQKREQKKHVRFNGKEYDRLADHIGKIPLVMVSPYDRDLINDGSEVRRKYVDGVIAQFDKFYLNDLLEYNKALQQRNRLLKQFADHRYFDENALTVWDDMLIARGLPLYEKRKQFLVDFNPLFEEYYHILSGGNEKVEIIYESQLHEHSFGELLQNARDKDRIMRFSTAGTHKDDLQLLINDFPVKKFGSQGQQKSFVIAIKLAQFEFTRRKKGFKPILLFDDIFDKLDNKRVSKIVELVSKENFGQVFITDTHEERIEAMFQNLTIAHKIFRVSAGTVTPNNSYEQK